MPLVTELATAKGKGSAPGWAYVPDTGFDPSKAPIVATSGKRTARAAPIHPGGELSARQQSKVATHLANLDKENHKDVQIVVPNRPRDIAARGLRGTMTPGVRKIMLSQKTIANHLDDEEAMIALQKQEQHASNKAAKPPAARGKRASIPQRASTTDDMDIEPQSQAIAEDASNTVPSPPKPREEHPLLKPHGPPLPTEQEIEALLAAPPLSYNAARAAPSTSTAPARQFCEICGYWGRARCMKCGTRICGLDCKNQHEETSCAKFWA